MFWQFYYPSYVLPILLFAQFSLHIQSSFMVSIVPVPPSSPLTISFSGDFSPHVKDVETKVVHKPVTMLGLKFKSPVPEFMLTNCHFVPLGYLAGQGELCH